MLILLLQVTVADVTLFTTAEEFLAVLPEVEAENAWLKSFLSNMRADPKVAKYLKERQ